MQEIERNKSLAQDELVGQIEQVFAFYGPMPTGVTVSHEGHIFANFPRWGDDVRFTVGELVAGKVLPFPNVDINRPKGDGDPTALVSVQSVVVDPRDRLWILDTGSPFHKPTVYGGPKLVGVDLQQRVVFQSILFPPDVAPPTTYLNDVRFDLRRGRSGMAFITDSSHTGPNGIVVVDLETSTGWRRLDDHPSTKPIPDFLPIVEGRPLMERPAHGAPTPYASGSDGIAISADGSRLFYCPLSSRRLYSVAVDALIDRSKTDEEVAATVRDEGNKGTGADGLESDAEGHIYITSYEHNAILRRDPSGQFETVVHDPRILWPDTLSLATDGYLYFTANQLHRQARFHRGQDLRHKPYSLFRTRVDAHPVLLR